MGQPPAPLTAGQIAQLEQTGLLAPEGPVLHPPLVTFASRRVPPPSTLYVGIDDFMLLQVFNSVAGQVVGVAGRLLSPNGDIKPFAFSLAPSSARASNLYPLALAEGFLLNVAVYSQTTGTQPGQTFCQLFLQRGGSSSVAPFAQLLSGYAWDGRVLGWPGDVFTGPRDGPGYVVQLSPSNPPVLTEYTLTVPTNATWRFKVINFSLITSATAGNRQQGFALGNPAATAALWNYIFSFTQAASLHYYYELGIGYGTGDTGVIALHANACLPDIWLLAGFTAATKNTGLLSGDQYQNIYLEYEEWIQP